MLDRDPLVEMFVSLTKMALQEKDEERFLMILKERDSLAERLFERDPDWVEMENVEDEERIIKRLEEMRRTILFKMENLWKRKRHLSSYQSRFPFPPNPKFFDQNS